jgi:hypothetical protein
VGVNYVSMMEGIAGQFESTILSAGSLNADKIAKGWQAMVVVGTLIIAFIVAILFSHYADLQTKKVAAIESKDTSRVNKASLTSKRARGRDTKVLIGASATSGSNNGILKLAEDALPEILSSKSLPSKIASEIKRYHRWIGVVFYYSQKFPRYLRVVSLATSVTIMLFIQSLTYSLTRGDDGSCEAIENYDSCLEPKSAFATGTSKCYWTPDSYSVPNGPGSCHFVLPDSSLEVVIFVAIFSAVASTPISLFADRIILSILAAPSALAPISNKEVKVEVNLSIFPTRSSNHESPTNNSEMTQLKSSRTVAERSLSQLTKELLHYRANVVSDEVNRREFNGKSGPTSAPILP